MALESKKNKKNFNLYRFKTEFILNCLQTPKSLYKTIPWAKEMKIMQTLCKKCGNPEFWRHATPSFKIPSLAWFLTDKGRIYLNEKYKRFYSKIETVDKKNVEKKLDKKVGEDIVLTDKFKLRTIKDFLNKKI